MQSVCRTLPHHLEHEDGRTDRDVERVQLATHGNTDVGISSLAPGLGESYSLRAHDNGKLFLRGEAGTLRPAAVMRDPASGRKLEVFTTEPCLQVYGAQNMDGTLAAKTPGRKYVKYAGLALETQHAPDSPNRPDFPSVALRPGETFRSTTLYRFSAE